MLRSFCTCLWELDRITHTKSANFKSAGHLCKASVTYLAWSLPLSQVLPLVDCWFQFKIATWFWQPLAGEPVNFQSGRSPGPQIPPSWWESREWMHVRTLFRLMNSHVGSGGVEKFADNPQAESHTLTNARSDGGKKEAETSLPLKLCICYFIKDCTGNYMLLFFK